MLAYAITTKVTCLHLLVPPLTQCASSVFLTKQHVLWKVGINRWAYFREKCTLCNSKKGGWSYFRGWASYFTANSRATPSVCLTHAIVSNYSTRCWTNQQQSANPICWCQWRKCSSHPGLWREWFTLNNRCMHWHLPYCPCGRTQLKHQKLRVGSCTEEVLEWFNYPHASAHPGWKVSCQGIPNWPASSLTLCFIKASPTVEKAVILLESGPTRNLIAKFPQRSSLAVREFCAASEEHC